jgi:hypothetical protein
VAEWDAQLRIMTSEREAKVSGETLGTESGSPKTRGNPAPRERRLTMIKSMLREQGAEGEVARNKVEA